MFVRGFAVVGLSVGRRLDLVGARGRDRLPDPLGVRNPLGHGDAEVIEVRRDGLAPDLTDVGAADAEHRADASGRGVAAAFYVAVRDEALLREVTALPLRHEHLLVHSFSSRASG